MAHSAEIDAAIMEPWGPFEMGGFEGCTDQDPDRCACATDQQPTCAVCGQEIDPGEKAWARQWPCYNTLPLSSPEQDWDVISWHDECPDTRVIPPGEPRCAKSDHRYCSHGPSRHDIPSGEDGS